MQFLKEFAASGKKNTSLLSFRLLREWRDADANTNRNKHAQKKKKKKKNYPNILSNAKLGLVFHKALQVYAV